MDRKKIAAASGRQYGNGSGMPVTRMSNVLRLTGVAILIALISACTNVERSRDLDNAKIPPQVTAIQVCSSCHGVTGNSKSPNFPRLAGQQVAYLEEQLKNFRNHQRADPEGFEYMWGISRKLTDDQISGLADYFSNQAPTPNPAGGKTDAKLVAEGKLIFENGIPAQETPPCSACHGPKAEGMTTFPRLADQHQDYMIKQLMVFKDTEGRPGTPMKQITHNLNKEQISAVTAYLQGFPH